MPLSDFNASLGQSRRAVSRLQTLTAQPTDNTSFEVMPLAAQRLLEQLEILISPPTTARNVMVLSVYGRGETSPQGEKFKQIIFDALSNYRSSTNERDQGNTSGTSYGRGETSSHDEEFKHILYRLSKRHSSTSERNQVNLCRSRTVRSVTGRLPRLNFAFVDFSRIWNGVLGGDPGFRAFGYSSTDPCIQSNPTFTTDGMCSDPDDRFYYFPG